MIERWSDDAGHRELAGVIEYLERRATRTEPTARVEFIRWLSMAGCASSHDLFCRELDEPACRRYAVTGLGRTGDERDASRLHAIFTDPAMPRIVRARCAQALGWIGSRSSVEVLIEAHTQAERVVRKAAAKALGRVAARSEEAEAVLVQRSSDDRAVVLVHIAEAMGYRGSEACARRLVELAQHPEPQVHATAKLELERITRRGHLGHVHLDTVISG